MKKLILILFLFLFTSCESREKLIVQSFNIQRAEGPKNKARKAEIYDTLYYSEVDENINKIQEKIKYLRFEIRKNRILRDSVFKLHYPVFKRDSLLRPGVDRHMFYEKEIEHLMFVEDFNRQLITQVDGNITAYYAKIITKRDTLDFLVTPLTYRIICPSFMIKYNF